MNSPIAIQSPSLDKGAQLVPEDQRCEVAARAFGGTGFPFGFEPSVYGLADQLSPEDYSGGCWEFYLTPTGAFFMAPTRAPGATFRTSWPDNYSSEEISAEAFGIVCCLFACSHLSFRGGPLAERCAENYHKLREWMFDVEHPETGAILALID